VSQDLFDHLRLFSECEEAHCAAVARADQGAHLVDLLDEPRPSALRRQWGYLGEFLDGVRDVGSKTTCFLALYLTAIEMPDTTP